MDMHDALLDAMDRRAKAARAEANDQDCPFPADLRGVVPLLCNDVQSLTARVRALQKELRIVISTMRPG